MRTGSGLAYPVAMLVARCLWVGVVLLGGLVPVALPGVQSGASADAAAATSSGQEQEGYPVTLDGEELFRVLTPLGPFSAEERARQSELRVDRIANDPFYSPDLFRIDPQEGEVVVYYRGDQVGSLSEKEAQLYGGTAREVTEGLVQKVKASIEGYRDRRRPTAWVQGAAITLGAALVLLMLVRLLGRAHQRLSKRLSENGGATLGRLLKLRRSLPAERMLEIELRLLGWLRTALIVLMAVVFLEVAFLALPFTRGVAIGLLHYVLDPVATLRDQFFQHVGDLAAILVIAVLARLFLRALYWIAREAQSGTISVPMVTRATAIPAYKVVRIVVIAVAAMMIYPYVPGSSSAAFKGVGLFAGALFTLGASGTANNLIGGVTLIFTDVYRVGDRIQIGEVNGDVVDVTLLITRLRTTKNEIVTLANGGMFSSKIVNYSREAKRRGLILHTTVTIGYDVPWRKVHELLIGAARSVDVIEKTPEPFVLQTSLDDFYVSYQLNAYTRTPNAMASTYSALHQAIQDAFAEAGVEIMSPHYGALRDGGAAALPTVGEAAGAPRPFVVRLEDRPQA